MSLDSDLLPQKATVMNCRQISVVDFNKLVQVLCFLHLVLELQSCAVQNLIKNGQHIFLSVIVGQS